MEDSFLYTGPEALRLPIERALRAVVDPELALSIVDVGLIYGVTVADGKVHVVLTMTSVACPVADLILDEIEAELERVIPTGTAVALQLVWEPPWSAGRMSPAG